MRLKGWISSGVIGLFLLGASISGSVTARAMGLLTRGEMKAVSGGANNLCKKASNVCFLQPCPPGSEEGDKCTTCGGATWWMFTCVPKTAYNCTWWWEEGGCGWYRYNGTCGSSLLCSGGTVSDNPCPRRMAQGDNCSC